MNSQNIKDNLIYDVDLHIHSNNSDGKFSVERILDYAMAKGISYIAITDHDTISGQMEAVGQSKKRNIHYITGIELNVTLSHPDLVNGKDISLDILGYNIDIHDKNFKNKLKEIADYRKYRIKKIIENINEIFESEGRGIKLTGRDFDKIISEYAGEGTVGRVHLARYLIDCGYANDIKDAFEHYLVKADVPKYRLTPEEGIDLIHKTGGYAFLAHPMDPLGTSLIKVSKILKEQLNIIKEYLIPMGLDGLECFHSRLTEEQRMALYHFSKDHNLLISAGSDCHQNPPIMGTVGLPEHIRNELFIFKKKQN